MVDTIWLVRHGMRADLENPEWRHTAARPHDTPLSETGLQQARDTARFLANKNINTIFASPFYRTLQTADIIARELGIKVNIERGICEWLNPEWFDSMPDIISEDEIPLLIPTVNTEYSSYVTPQFPEVDENVHVYGRVQKTLEKIISEHKGAVLLVGHGSSVLQAARALANPSHTSFNMEMIKMCSAHKLEREKDIWKLSLSSTEHLSTVIE